MITFTTSKHYWNYYLALENDLQKSSRYIEFTKANLKSFSIEFVHLLQSASSEVDVLMKLFCEILDPNKKCQNIYDYRKVVVGKCPSMIQEEIILDRFGMKYQPWINWQKGESPNWWKSYNKVKHKRNAYFNEANLKNVVNSIGALHILVVYYYKFVFSKEARAEIDFRSTTLELKPESELIKINNDNYYYHTRIC